MEDAGPTGRRTLADRLDDTIEGSITSGIRHGLGLVATSSGGETVTRIVRGQKFKVTVPGTGNPKDTVIDLAINAGGVLLLVLALWLVRHRIAADGHVDER